MPKSSRHKSSKHSSRDVRDYSDSEKDSGLKERSGVRVSKESGSGSGSGEKRKLDSNSKESKENVFASGNGDYVEEYNNNSSSKRRKDRADDGVNDRWNGGGEDDRTEGSRKSKASSESKSKRRDESEGKHRESSRKESRESERERERKGREGKSERFVESEDHGRASVSKQSVVNEKTELNAQDLLQSPEPENQLERRVRRRRDGSGEGDKHEVDVGDTNDRRRDNVANDVSLKDEKHKDERYRDKYREDVERDSRHRDDKQRDEHSTRDHANSRSDDKHLRDEKDAAESRQKKTKPQDSDRDREREYDHDHDHEHDFDSGRDRDRDRYRERDRDRDYDHDRKRDRVRDHDGDRDWDRERNRDVERERDRDRRDRERDREWERERERERNRDRDRDLDNERERDLDHDGSHPDDRSVRHKDSRGKKRSPDERDDYSDTKSRGIKGHYPDMENKSLSSSRVESDADRGRSQSRQTYVDSTMSNRRRTSPSPSSHGGADDYRHSKQEDKYRDSVTEQRSKANSSREVSGFSGATERGSKYRSSERSNKIDDGHLGELPVERSSSSKASPMGMVERSPSSTSLDRRYMNRTGVRRSLDVEEMGRRGSVGPRELSTTEDRLSRDLPLEKPLVDDSSQMDLLYYNRNNQSGSSSSLPPPPAFRAGVGSPSFMGSLEEDGRGNISARYRRSGDPNLGRGQGNAWRGPPNWSSPVPNGFIPFQHGPPHGGFQAMMPQFPSPSLFAVRPSMEINHSGLPYHIPDADRFSSHLRPLGWQNMMDGSGPTHLHGWDGNNSAFRDEPHIYGGSDWDQNRHMMNGRGWETSSDMWKGENGDANMDLPSMSQKEDLPMQAPSDDGLAGKVGHQAASYENNHHGVVVKSDEPRSIGSPAKDSSKVSLKTVQEISSDSSRRSSDDDVAQRCRLYLSKLDISADLAGEELYSKCMSLLGTYKTVTLDTDTDVIVNLKDGGRAVPKSSKTLLSPPFFPAANDSVFQRAMNYYKKQSVQTSGIINGGKVDIVSKLNEDKVEQVSLCNVDKVEGLVLIKDSEMLDAPMSTQDHEKPEAISHEDVPEVTEEKVSASCPMVQDNTSTIPLNAKAPNQDLMPNQVLTPKSPEEPVHAFNGVNEMDGMTSEQVIMEGEDGHHSLSLDNTPHAVAVLVADDNKTDEEISKSKSNDSVSPPEGRQVLGDAVNDPLFLSDGSPKISNESESVILNRIHHSPESTH